MEKNDLSAVCHEFSCILELINKVNFLHRLAFLFRPQLEGKAPYYRQSVNDSQSLLCAAARGFYLLSFIPINISCLNRFRLEIYNLASQQDTGCFSFAW